MTDALSKREWHERTNGFIRIVDEVRGQQSVAGPYEVRAVQYTYPNHGSEDGWPECWDDVPDAHAAAALLLADQPFGFTWADVDNVVDVAPDLAARIAALLPPRNA